MMVLDLSKDQVVSELERLDLDWGDEDDAKALVDVLLQRYTPTQVLSWLTWLSIDGMAPIIMLRDGRAREVFAAARRMVA